MVIAVFALVGTLIGVYMSLYKLGVIETLACGSAACESVQSSPWAVFLGIPVPFLGVAGYASIMALALAGLHPGPSMDRRIASALLALTSIAFAYSIYLSWVEAVLIQAWCRWCIASAVVSTLLFLSALPELPRLRTKASIS
jgi:uncharacterized membrane protein